MSSELGKRALMAGAIAATLGTFLVRTAVRARTAATPLAVKAAGQKLLLVNMSAGDAVALSSVLGSWASALTVAPATVNDYVSEDCAGNPAARAEALARHAFAEAGGEAFAVAQSIGIRIAEPGSASAKSNYEMTDTATVDRTKLVQYANKLAGCVAEATCYVALMAPGAADVRMYTHTCAMRVCAADALPEGAAYLEDLLVVDTRGPPQSLFPHIAQLQPVADLRDAGFDYAAGAAAAAASSPVAMLGEGMSSALLLRPYRWRAYLALAYDVMYAPQQRRFDALLRAERGLAATALATISSAWTGLRRALPGRGSPTSDEARRAQLDALGYDASSPLCGRFENHITVNFGQARTAGATAEGAADAAKEESDRFMALAAALGVKIVSIALPRGAQYPAQVMTSYYTTGHVRQCTAALLEEAALLAMCGFRAARVKMELQLTEDTRAPFFQQIGAGGSTDEAELPLGLCPLDDDLANDQRLMGPLQYFEFHVKLAIPVDAVRDATPAVAEVAKAHGSHLSKNAFKVYVATDAVASPADRSGDRDGRSCLYFLTLRKYRLGFASCLATMHALRDAASAALEPFGGRVTTVQREFSVFDSNTGLDEGWFDRSHVTPSFMFEPSR